MKIKSISLRDFACFESLDIEPGTVTVISAANGNGKSSILKALLSVFEGGWDPSVIRDWGKPTAAKRAVVSLLLDNETLIKKTTTHKQSTLEVVAGDGTKVASPAAYVSQLASGFALDPISFVAAGQKGAAGWKERQKFLQTVLPTSFTAEEIEAAGCELDDAEKVLATWDIEAFDLLLKNRFERRTAVNTKKETLDGTITTLTRSLPGETGSKDWAKEAKELEADIQRAQSIVDQELVTVDRDLDATLADFRQQFEQACADARAEAEKQRQAIREVAQKQMDPKKAELAVAQERARAADKVAGTKADIEKVRAQSREAGKVAVALDRAIEGLRDLKKAKLSQSPLPGIEIRDGRLFVDGKDYDSQLNTATQMTVAFQLASLGVGKMGLMLCDRGESFDDSTWQEFLSAAAASGLQVIVAKVSSGDLKIEAINA